VIGAARARSRAYLGAARFGHEGYVVAVGMRALVGREESDAISSEHRGDARNVVSGLGPAYTEMRRSTFPACEGMEASALGTNRC
jgi:hypothetical protein